MHLITPIFKSGDRSSVNNYWPISLLCILSKVFEQIIYDQVSEFVISTISVVQFGFLRHRSTVHQLLLFIDQLLNSLNHKSQFDTIYLDFSKAFDKVPHNLLLTKLRQIGIDGNLWLLLQHYLINRSHCVAINNHVSPQLPVLSGVPQGSILGPLLFLIYVNDLPSSTIHSSLLMFADDTKCLKPIASPHDAILLQHDLNLLSAWSHTWLLPFNASKCSILHFFSSSSVLTPDYYLDSTPIPSSNHHKDLGVIFTTDLSWSNHYSHIASSAYKLLGLLRRSFSVTNLTSTKKLLYIALIKSRLTYASPVWRPHLIKDIVYLENIQRRATKFILNDFRSDYKSRLSSLHLLPLMMSFEINDILFFLKNCHLPQDCFDITTWFKFTSSSTRSSSSNKLSFNRPRNISSHHPFFEHFPRLWNALPNLDMSLSLSTLKKQIKQVFWNHFVSTFDPNNLCTYHFVCLCNSCTSLPLRTNFLPARQPVQDTG